MILLFSSAIWTWASSTGWTVEGAQLAIDTTMVSPLHSDGTAIRQAAAHDGAALEAARRGKERVYPELSGDEGEQRLVVFAAEMGERWSNETDGFMCALAKAGGDKCPSS